MLNNCIYFKIRTNKGKKYFYCLNNKIQIDYKNCSNCEFKEYKEYKKLKSIKPINAVSKHKKTVSKKTYDIVMERDGRCRLCGSQVDLHLHHIIYRSQDVNLIDEPGNCIILCLKCHKLCHSNKKKYQILLKNLL